MKKLLTVAMSLAISLTMVGSAFGQTMEPKIAPEVNLEADATITMTEVINIDELKIGQTLPLKVSALKKASAATVAWSVKGFNSVDGTTFTMNAANYVLTGEAQAVVESVATASALEPVEYWVAKGSFTGNAAGTYEITTVMTMTAGKSDVSWVNEDSINVAVVNPVTLVGFDSVTIKLVNETNKNGNITGVNAVYDLYMVFSDGSKTLYQAGLTESLGSGQLEDKSTKILFEKVQYPYTVSKTIGQ